MVRCGDAADGGFRFVAWHAIMLPPNMRITSDDNRWEPLAASKIYEIFEDVVKPPGFQKVKKGALGRQVSADVIHLINLAHYKGAMYGFRWGVSSSYLPHRWEKELRWHRSVKSATLDLWEQLADLPEALNLSQLPPNSSIPSGLHGPELFEQNLRREWRDLESTISSWFDKVTDLAGVLAMAEQQMRRVWSGPRHFPPPSLVHAFTLARLGHPVEAEAELNAITKTEIPDPKSLLFQALQKIASQSFRGADLTD